MKFVGIDLAWGEKKQTGLCLLELDHDESVQLKVLSTAVGHQSVLSWLDANVDPYDPAVVAVDAPLIITNVAGQRPCEGQIGRTYGARNASCHTMNLRNGSAARLLRFSEDLTSRQFEHGLECSPKHVTRQQIEVYPHPATIELFGLASILMHKHKPKRPHEVRSAEMAKLRNSLLSLSDAAPRLDVDPDCLPGPAVGQVLSKATMDQAEQILDAVVCAYIAAHWWFWGKERNSVFGDRQSGYIIVPRREQH